MKKITLLMLSPVPLCNRPSADGRKENLYTGRATSCPGTGRTEADRRNTGFYPVRRSRKKSGKTGLRSRSGQIDIQARRDGLCHLEHQFLFTFGRPGRRSNRPVQQREAERCRRHYAGRPRFEHQDENRQEGKHQLFHERYRQWYLCQCFPVLATRQPSGYRNRQPEFQFKPDNLQRLSGT